MTADPAAPRHVRTEAAATPKKASAPATKRRIVDMRSSVYCEG